MGQSHWFFFAVLGFALVPVCSHASAPEVSAGGEDFLTLDQAQRLAVADDPAVVQRRHLARAQREQAVADGELPDPKVRFGLANFPADNFSRTDTPMTQIKVGVVQAFPAGSTLTYRRRRTETLAEVEEALEDDRRRQVVRDVRLAWLDVYHEARAREVIDHSRRYFEKLAAITEDQYAAGRARQQDVIRAQVELSRLDDRRTRILAREDQARARLAKWVGDAGRHPLPDQLPELPALPQPDQARERLPLHPLILAENARISANRLGSDIAREQYKPGWALDVSYGQRGGQDPDGSDRPDLVSAMVVMDLPIFPDKRQDRRLAASEQKAMAAKEARDERLKELVQQLDAEFASWTRLGERERLYLERLLAETRANVEAATTAYQAGVTEFINLMRAQITDLDTRLDQLAVRVDRAKAQARLLYLVGDPS
jgi:outer membrane protein TolC